MLNLKHATDIGWAHIANNNIEEILTDHAYCEQKAASSAISIIVNFPEYSNVVKELTDIAIEEMSHFKMVIRKIEDRGLSFGRERKDKYVNELLNYFPKSGNRKTRLINRLLISAMIEARSCERFKVLADNLPDEELSKFYFDLMKSEARHYRTFLDLAISISGDENYINHEWNKFLDFEATIMMGLGKLELIHG